MATSGHSHDASMVGLARGANDAPTCGGKQGVRPAPECNMTGTRMMAKLTRLQHKVADESCCYQGREDLPRTPTDGPNGPTTTSRFYHCPLVTPDSIGLGQSDEDSCDGQVAPKRGQGRALVRVDSSSDGDSSSATDITETLTMSLRRLGHGPSTPSSSLKSCLSSSTENFDRRRGNGNHRHVQFDSIKIRRYQVILGDNPEVSVGPPISLGWTFSSIAPINVDAYEEHRSSKNRRQGNELVLPAFMRRQILLRNNLSTSAEIADRVKEVNAIQKKREATVKWLPFSRVEEGAESAKRKASRAFSQVLNRKSSPSDTSKNCKSPKGQQTPAKVTKFCYF